MSGHELVSIRVPTFYPSLPATRYCGRKVRDKIGRWMTAVAGEPGGMFAASQDNECFDTLRKLSVDVALC
jgi:hypothetical protein